MPSTATTRTVTGLTNGVAYQFRVAAVNALGTGPFSTASAAVTPAIALPAISGLQLHLDAADASTLYDATTGGSLVAADGGVARWEDKSGNGRHATQGTSANRPARKTAIQGGKDVLRFDGSNDSLSIPSSTATFKFLHSADSTVFAVFKSGTTASPGTFYVILGNNNGASAQNGVYLATADSDPATANDMVEWFVGRGEPSTWPVYSGNNNYFPSNVFGLISLVSKPADATSGNRVALRKNGGSLSTENAPFNAQTVSTADAQNNFIIGALAGAVVSAFLDGDIAEIIIYDSALSDTDRGLVEAYLMSKWAVT